MEVVSWHPYVLQKNKGFISRFPSSDRIQICSQSEFELSRESLTKYGRTYDKNISFFDNFSKILTQTVLPNIFHYRENINSDFTDTAVDSKNTYLSNSVVLYSEDVLYSFMVRGECRNILNSMYISSSSENIYSSRGVLESYKIFYSSYIQNSNNIYFSSNLIGCSECLFCNRLENKKYYIENIKYTESEYFQKKAEILKDKQNFSLWYSQIETKWKNNISKNVTGNYVVQSENVESGSYVFHTKDARNIMFVWAKEENRDIYDVFILWGSGRSDLYWVQSSWWSDKVYCSACIGYSHAIYYSYFLEGCSFCLWCVGLKNKSFCILNKQYTKEEWYTLTSQIFSGMDKKWILWDFFPGSMNPFYFNDTMAWLLYGFTKEEVMEKWYMWRDEKLGVDIPDTKIVIWVWELAQYQGYDRWWNWVIDTTILEKVIEDEEGNYYKIVRAEYDFLMKHGLPLPELHWVERMKQHLSAAA